LANAAKRRLRGIEAETKVFLYCPQADLDCFEHIPCPVNPYLQMVKRLRLCV